MNNAGSLYGNSRATMPEVRESSSRPLSAVEHAGDVVATNSRVLIAEDDATSRMILESILKKWGYEVISASDGNEAWSVVQRADSPQLVILDWEMPGMDGPHISRRIREMRADSPFYIILLTAHGSTEDIVDGLEAGANDHITKPFDKSELRARLRVGERVIDLQNALANRARELEEAMSHIKTLQGILPICMHCHMIRDDRESWQRIERYIEKHSDAHFSHDLCPTCLDKYYKGV